MSSATIQTSDADSIKPFLAQFQLPKKDSHKGQNGKLFIIGGSSLFHSALIWAAETASYFADMVHASSTPDNNEILLSLKKKWQNGIVIPEGEREHYVREDDAILIGTGMMREGKESKDGKALIKHLFDLFPEKKWVIDAGALQIMNKDWLRKFKTKPLLTPHQKEFQSLFGDDILSLSREQKIKKVIQTAKEYQVILLVKCGYDIVSDGKQTVVVEGGNAGLTKGGTGDILASLAACFYTKHEGVQSAILSSYLLKLTADELFKQKKYWFNNSDIISSLPKTLSGLLG
ncbi:hydroxyethylthiazole kinase [Candidatus Roizmanbacteria bacterium]|nr:hydroxyethylthiazole kinase [Candidatus Roizmanbacteria bacterium]